MKVYIINLQTAQFFRNLLWASFKCGQNDEHTAWVISIGAQVQASVLPLSYLLFYQWNIWGLNTFKVILIIYLFLIENHPLYFKNIFFLLEKINDLFPNNVFDVNRMQSSQVNKQKMTPEKYTIQTFKSSRCIKASFYIPENKPIYHTTKGFRMKISMKLFFQLCGNFV